MRQLIILFLLLGGTATFAQTKELTLEDAVMQQWRNFYPQHTSMVNWIPGTTTYSSLSADYQTLKKTDAKKAKEESLCTTVDLKDWTGEKFSWMNVVQWKDGSSFYTETGGKYFLVNLVDKKAKPLGVLPEGAENGTLCQANNHVAYTVGSQLYVKTDMNKELIVTESVEGIVSGQAIARSEFGITGGIFWSNTGKYLGFYQKDESGVADYPLLDITTPTGTLKSIKYPMAGQTSEKSMTGIYEISSGKTLFIQPQGKADDYITNFAWGPSDKYFYVIELNREQNHSKLQKYNAETCALEATLIEEKNDVWVEPEHPIYFVNEHEFIYFSEKDGFMNLYLYNDEGKFLKQLTTNKWVVEDIVGHDAAGNIYFTGTGENPTQTQYYKVNIKSGQQTQLTHQGTHSASFSSDYKYFFDAMSSHDVPNLEGIYDGNGKKVREVLKADNPLSDYKIGTAEIGTIKAGDGETDLYYRLIKPSDFDQTKKYPVLVYVYGGPHAQLVTDTWLDGLDGGAGLPCFYGRRPGIC